jgi:predicted kinase
MKPSGTTKPHMIIMVGIPGSGKSYFAEKFAETFKSPVINFGRIHKTLFANPKFDEIEEIIVKKAADYMLSEMLKTGRTIIFKGPTGKKSDRIEIAKKARSSGYDPIFVWVQTDSVTARKRATKSIDGRPPMTDVRFDNYLKQFSAPHASERAVVISGKHTYNSQLKIVLKSIVKPPEQPTFTNNFVPKNQKLIQ